MTPSGRRDFADLEREAHKLAIAHQDEPGFNLADFIRAELHQPIQIGRADYGRVSRIDLMRGE